MLTPFPPPYVALLLALLLPAQAFADEGDPINLLGSARLQHDSNLFRLPGDADSQRLLGKPDKSDQILITSLGVQLDKPYGLQRFELDANLTNYRYRNFRHLDSTARNYTAAWQLQLTPQLHGRLSGSRTDTLNTFADVSGYDKRNLRTEERRRFDGSYDVSGSVRLLAGVGRYSKKSNQTSSVEDDYRVNSREGGVRYESPSGASVSLVTKRSDGTYLNRPQLNPATMLDSSFDERSNEVRLRLPAGGSAAFDARLARIERKHAHFSERDFSGTVGNLSLNWNITGKTQLAASVMRELSSAQSNTASYVESTRFLLAPYWQITEKAGMRLRYVHEVRDYLGQLSNAMPLDQSDTLDTAMIEFEWRPLRSLLMSTSLQTDLRSSNLPRRDYRSQSTSISAQYTF
ncbi:XrtB/PEP-CTERM-associated polysaccharide biosynthesis outer membrane protein EpsL [Chitinimonas arctica]|nr:XrtB/PEP-CTERM-associated polysaccharide biosynthesis outer membrane protein EpsL [Chitinimonas arctica]